jgi:hypothetical protein
MQKINCPSGLRRSSSMVAPAPPKITRSGTVVSMFRAEHATGTEIKRRRKRLFRAEHPGRARLELPLREATKSGAHRQLACSARNMSPVQGGRIAASDCSAQNNLAGSAFNCCLDFCVLRGTNPLGIKRQGLQLPRNPRAANSVSVSQKGFTPS